MDALAHLPPSSSGGTDSATLFSSGSFDTKADVDVSRDSDTHTAVSLTPPPSMLNAASAQALVSSAQQHAVPPTYYPTQAWAAPYGAPMQFPMPFGAYGGAVYPTVPMQYAASSGADSSSTATNAQVQWGPVYRVRPTQHNYLQMSTKPFYRPPFLMRRTHTYR